MRHKSGEYQKKKKDKNNKDNDICLNNEIELALTEPNKNSNYWIKIWRIKKVKFLRL